MAQSIGIIGGTGRQGSAFAKRLVVQGCAIQIGSRSTEKGTKCASDLNSKLGTTLVSGGDNQYALQSDVIVLAIPFDQVNGLISPYLDLLKNKIVLDMTVNLEFGKFIKTHLHNGLSSYEYIRDFLPDSRVVACLKTISYAMLDKDHPLDDADFQITTSDAAYQFSSQVVSAFGLTPVRVRGKVHAHTIERMVALSIQLNKAHPGSHVGFQVTNLIL
jgi:NADPH-dependent F420 reductase